MKRKISTFLASVIIAGSFMAIAAHAAQPEDHTHGTCASGETVIEPRRAVPCGCGGFYRKVIGGYRCDKCGDFIEGDYLS